MIKTSNIASIWKRLAVVLSLVFTLQIVNQALFYHAHIIDGKVYAHAHPGEDNHQHNRYELSFYAQLQLLNSEEAPQLLASYLPVFVREIDEQPEHQITPFILDRAKGRAPPAA
ncbi:MAG: hypothetical protein N4A74_19395 [Carboxylicivirga sp.]|jgi:hypothetical protein|nr:hypothetical protein [Carboxylicivirga sp.]